MIFTLGLNARTKDPVIERPELAHVSQGMMVLPAKEQFVHLVAMTAVLAGPNRSSQPTLVELTLHLGMLLSMLDVFVTQAIVVLPATFKNVLLELILLMATAMRPVVIALAEAFVITALELAAVSRVSLEHVASIKQL
jgi:hypothetical protein